VPPQLDEVDEARKVVNKVAEFWRTAGVGVVTFHDDVSRSQSENLNRIVAYHNSQSRDRDVSVHFNAYSNTSKPMGVEVLYVTQQTLAADTSRAIAEAGAFINRGAKYRNNLAFLNGTAKPAILIEVCFCDSTADSNLYRQHFDSICRRIAEVVGGITIGEPEEPPIEPIEPPVPPTPSEENRVEVTTEIVDTAIYVNGVLVRGREEDANTAKFDIKLFGDVSLIIDGEPFHDTEAEPGIAENHKNIEATVFGGSDDPNNSAYPPFARLDGDHDDFVALPCSFSNSLFPNNAPRVRVYVGELSAEGRVADKGPWTTDDESYVHGNNRPIAETCYLEGAPLPSGPNKGRVPTNKAGIDLSPHLASKIGLKGKGLVDWEFVEEETA
jgi:N-acetylmuramoyl-L-alanine amidase